MVVYDISEEYVNMIFEYYGKIKYEKGEYINIIDKYDYRYDMVEEVIKKK